MQAWRRAPLFKADASSAAASAVPSSGLSQLRSSFPGVLPALLTSSTFSAYRQRIQKASCELAFVQKPCSCCCELWAYLRRRPPPSPALHDFNHRRAGLPLAVFWLGASCPLDASQLSAAKRATAQQFSIRPHLARPGHTPPGEEYRQFTGQPVTLPVDERALMAGVVSAHCSTSPPARHCRRLVSRGERAPSGATDVD